MPGTRLEEYKMQESGLAGSQCRKACDAEKSSSDSRSTLPRSCLVECQYRAHGQLFGLSGHKSGRSGAIIKAVLQDLRV